VILVDSSVWIDHLRDTVTEQVTHLRSLMSGEELLVGDLVLCEVLQGLRSDAEARIVEEALREFEVVPLVDAELAVKAAANYRFLRSLGFTVRRTIDLLIALSASSAAIRCCTAIGILHRCSVFWACRRSDTGPRWHCHPSGSKRRSMSPASRPARVPPAAS
jgi:predicted nucleic acid-binding protein